MKPTPVLSVRLRFSTKDVGKGFYRGNRTGSLGAHTSKGGYLIDYRKVRSYNVPDLKDFKLTPFVTREIPDMEQPEVPDYELEREYNQVFGQGVTAQDLSIARRKRALNFLNDWKQKNTYEFNEINNYQVEGALKSAVESFKNGESVEILEKLKLAYQKQNEFQNR